MASLVERLRKRAEAARLELTATALGDALHFEEAADRITALEAMCETLAGALATEPTKSETHAYQGAGFCSGWNSAVDGYRKQRRQALTQYRAMKEKNDG